MSGEPVHVSIYMVGHDEHGTGLGIHLYKVVAKSMELGEPKCSDCIWMVPTREPAP